MMYNEKKDHSNERVYVLKTVEECVYVVSPSWISCLPCFGLFLVVAARDEVDVVLD